MRRYLPQLLLFAASACGAVRTLPSSDSTRVEVRIEVKTVHDTAYIELPVIMERVATLDTASVLENLYAKSEASVSGGVLTHTLETKPVRQPVPVETKIIVRVPIVYRDRIRTETVEVEKKLTPWQSLKMRIGTITLVVLLAAVIHSIFLIVKCFKSKFQ